MYKYKYLCKYGPVDPQRVWEEWKKNAAKTNQEPFPFIRLRRGENSRYGARFVVDFEARGKGQYAKSVTTGAGYSRSTQMFLPRDASNVSIRFQGVTIGWHDICRFTPDYLPACYEVSGPLNEVSCRQIDC
jgi:hypothetical protein